MSRHRNPYRVKKDTRRDKATGKVILSQNWYVRFYDHLDIERTVKGTPDQATTDYIGRNLAALVSLRSCNQPLTRELRSFIENQPQRIRDKLIAWGLLDANTNASFEPLMKCRKVKANCSKRRIFDITGGHLLHWKLSMENADKSVKHTRESVAGAAKFVKASGFLMPSDITGEHTTTTLSELKDKEGLKVANSRLACFKAFVRWMVRTGRLSVNPVQYVSPFKDFEKTRPRRALTEEEIETLLTSTADSGEHHGLSGYERCLVYRLALTTGLRYNEIRTLKRSDFTFGSKPSVTVTAGNAKNRKTDTLPLQPELAMDLKQHFEEYPALPNAQALGLWTDAGADMLKPDLRASRIEYETEEGVADFHSLRHTFGTLLARSGVPPQEAQRLMRHSDINLTMNIYTHIGLLDKARAIDKLPVLRPKAKEVKTGTSDVPEKLTVYLTGNPGKTR